MSDSDAIADSVAVLTQDLGDAELAWEIIGEFAKDAASALAQAEQATTLVNQERLLHQLKGMAKTVRFDGLAALLATSEAECRAGRIADLTAVRQRLTLILTAITGSRPR
jgi:HPt (histidine-containing phosphotransfer) domain-containing protein